jgi:NAD(P)-dependent dehydrogenase (short-subunit alcohol dehydrogenase family)
MDDQDDNVPPVDRWTADAIPDLSGRIAVVTGSNSGIGFEAARTLVNRGAHCVLACRSTERADDAAQRISAAAASGGTNVIHLDLASLASVRRFADEFSGRFDRLDILVNNAGVLHGPHRTTEDGFERQLGTNHLGHFALTGLLIGRLVATPDSRVVTVSSLAHRDADIDLDDLMFDRGGYSPHRAYGRSKLANLLFTFELQRRFAAREIPMKATAAHPGLAATELADDLIDRWWKRPVQLGAFMLMQSAAQGALPTLRAATDPHAPGGAFYGPSRWGQTRGAPVLVDPSSRARDPAVAADLWTRSEHLTGVTFGPLDS